VHKISQKMHMSIYRNYTHTHTHTHTRLTALCPGLPGWAGTRKVKPIWILLEQEIVSGQWHQLGMCKSAPRSTQITMPAPHRSVFTGRMPFLPPNQQRQSTEGTTEITEHPKWCATFILQQQPYYGQWPLHRSTCISQHPQLRTGGFRQTKKFTECMSLLMRCRTLGLGCRHEFSPTVLIPYCSNFNIHITDRQLTNHLYRHIIHIVSSVFRTVCLAGAVWTYRTYNNWLHSTCTPHSKQHISKQT